MRIRLPHFALAALTLAALAWIASHPSLPEVQAAAPGDEGTSAHAAEDLPDAPRGVPDAGPELGARLAEPLGPAGHSAGEAATGSASPRVRGRVVDEQGGAVAGATVLGARHDGRSRLPLDVLQQAQRDHRDRTGVEEARTDASGRFELPAPDGVRLRLAVRAEGFAPYDDDEVSLRRAGDTDLGEVALRAGAALGGVVVDERGAPVGGAEIWRPDPALGIPWIRSGGDGACLLACTGADGAFRITLPAGPYRLLAHAARHPDRLVAGALDRAGASDLSLRVVLRRGATIAGTVVREDGAPLAVESSETWLVRASRFGALRLEEGEASNLFRDVSVQADGTFAVEGLLPGEPYRLRTRSPLGDDDFSESAPVDAEAGSVGVVIAVRASAALVFRPVSAEDGTPLLDVRARARWYGPRGHATERAGGPEERLLADLGGGRLRLALDLGGASADDVELVVSKPGYGDGRADVGSLQSGEERELGTIALETRGTFAVRVTDGASGAALAQVEVDLRVLAIDSDGEVEESFSSRATTGEDGLARVEHRASARGFLQARGAGYAPSAPLLIDVPPASEPLEVALSRGASLAVRAVDSSGAAVRGARVACSRLAVPGDDPLEVEASASSQSQATDAEGLALFEHLRPGRYRAVLWGPSLAGEMEGTSREIELGAGASAEIELSSPLLARLSGRVTEGGRALAGAVVILTYGASESGGRAAQRRTDDSGGFEIARLRPGPCTLRIAHADRALPWLESLELKEGANGWRVDLPATLIQGRVADENGRGIARARVQVSLSRSGYQARRRNWNRPNLSSVGDALFFALDGDGGRAGQTTLRCDGEGRYEIRGAPSDADLSLTAFAALHQRSAPVGVRLARGEARRGVDFALAGAGALAVRVVHARGEGVRPGCNVWIQRAGGSAKGGQKKAEPPELAPLDARGACRFEELAPGTWSVRANWASGQKALGEVSAQATVEAGRTTEVELVIP